MSGRVVAVGGIGVEEAIRRHWVTGAPGAWIGHRHDLRVGGTAALGAVAAAAVGAAARCVGAVGTDPAGTACRRHLARADVDVTTVLTVPGPTSRILRPADWDVDGAGPYHVEAGRSGLGDLLILPGAGWGAESVGVERALQRCEPGDVLLVEWSTLQGTAQIVEAAYERDLQILALMSPYPAMPSFDLRLVDVAVVDTRGAARLADAGDTAASLCVIVGRQGLFWAGTTVLAPCPGTSNQPVDRAHAVLAGALAGRLACGDDREPAAEAALALQAAYERGIDPYAGVGPWPGLRLDVEELG